MAKSVQSNLTTVRIAKYYLLMFMTILLADYNWRQAAANQT